MRKLTVWFIIIYSLLMAGCAGKTGELPALTPGDLYDPVSGTYRPPLFGWSVTPETLRQGLEPGLDLQDHTNGAHSYIFAAEHFTLGELTWHSAWEFDGDVLTVFSATANFTRESEETRQAQADLCRQAWEQALGPADLCPEQPLWSLIWYSADPDSAGKLTLELKRDSVSDELGLTFSLVQNR